MDNVSLLLLLVLSSGGSVRLTGHEIRELSDNDGDGDDDMMMSIFKTHDSMNLNAQCAQRDKEEERRREKS